MPITGMTRHHIVKSEPSLRQLTALPSKTRPAAISVPEFVADVADRGAVRLAQALSDVQRDHPLGVAGEDRWPIRQCFWRVKGRAALGVFRFLDHRQVHVLQGKQDPPLGGIDLRPTSYVLRPVEDRDRAGGGGRRGRQPAAA